jgi:hypothetical protein
MLGKHTLGPKEKTFLRITFDTRGSPGRFRKVVTVSTDIPGQEELEVTVEGIVREAPCAKIQVAPRRVDLGAVFPGHVKMEPFAVTNHGSLPLVITKIYVKGTGVVLHDGKRQGDLIILPGDTKVFEWALEADKGPGDHQEMIVLESNAKNAPKGGYSIMVRYRGS